MIAIIRQKMNPFLVNRDKRMQLLLFVALLLFMIVAARFVWSWMREYDQELDQRIEMKILEYGNLQRLIAGSQEFASQASSLHEFRERLAREHLVKEASPPLSEAMFQNIVNQLTTDNGVDVLSMRMLPRAEHEGVLLLRLVINTRAEISAIQDFLTAVESNPRILFFEEMEIKQISQNERRFLHFNAHLAAVTE